MGKKKKVYLSFTSNTLTALLKVRNKSWMNFLLLAIGI